MEFLKSVTILGMTIAVYDDRTRTHSDYTCWLSKMCWGAESKYWRKVIVLFVACLGLWNAPGLLFTTEYAGDVVRHVVSVFFSPSAHSARNMAGLVIAARHWSASWVQLGDFVDACGEALVAKERRELAGRGALAAYGATLVQMGLIQVCRIGEDEYVVCDGPLVLLVNHILSIGGQESCKLSAEMFLLVCFFFGLGDEAIRDMCCAFIYAACFYGAISMGYIQHLGSFFRSYENVAKSIMPNLREIVRCSEPYERARLAVGLLLRLEDSTTTDTLNLGFPGGSRPGREWQKRFAPPTVVSSAASMRCRYLRR